MMLKQTMAASCGRFMEVGGQEGGMRSTARKAQQRFTDVIVLNGPPGMVQDSPLDKGHHRKEQCKGSRMRDGSGTQGPILWL